MKDSDFEKIAGFAVKKAFFEPYGISLDELKNNSVVIAIKLMTPDNQAAYNGPKERSTVSIQITFSFKSKATAEWIKTKIK